MSNEYHWRDGWALTYPHPIKVKEVPMFKENIYRCPCSGLQVFEGNVCPLCKRKVKNDNTRKG